MTIVLYLLNYYLQIKEIILSIFNVPGVISLALNKLEHVDLKLYWKLLLFKLDHFNNIFLCTSKNLTCYFCCHGKKKKKNDSYNRFICMASPFPTNVTFGEIISPRIKISWFWHQNWGFKKKLNEVDTHKSIMLLL